MDIVLHLGAHRCATTTFQTYLDTNRDRLHHRGVAVWTPQDTRAGLFNGMLQADTRQIGVIRDKIVNMAADQLIVSEENMIGSPRHNLKSARLYPDIGSRLGQYAQAFDGHVRRIGLAIRSYDSYWTSAMSYAAMRGDTLPDRAHCAALAVQPFTWTSVAQTIRKMFPNAPLHIWVFEVFAGRPRRQFTMLSDRHDLAHQLVDTPVWRNNTRSVRQLRKRLRMHGHLNAAAMLPPGHAPWQPFTTLERHHMAAQYADDIRYFQSGADPAIHFTHNAAIKVQRHKTPAGTPAFDTGEYHDRQAKMG